MEKAETIHALVKHLDRAQQARATISLQAILDCITAGCRRFGNELDIDLRTIASQTNLNLKRVHKWMRRLVELGVLEVVSKGSYKGDATTYLVKGGARGTHLLISKKTEERAQDKQHRVTQLTLHEEDSLEITTETEHAFSSINSFKESNSRNFVAPSSYMRCVPLADLADLPDISEGSVATNEELREQLRVAPCSSKKWKTRHRETLGQQFVSQLWEQCQNQKVIGGQYQYPIHPDVFPLVYELDKAILEGRPTDAINAMITNLCYGADGRLRERFKYLFQPAKETRRKCPACEARGRKRTLRLTMVRSPHGTSFGAIRMKCTCDDCRYIGDVWKEFPAFGKPQSEQSQNP